MQALPDWWISQATLKDDLPSATANSATKLPSVENSTRPQMASRICRLGPYCSFTERPPIPMPAPAGTTRIVCLGSSRMISGIQLLGYSAPYYPVAQDFGQAGSHSGDRGIPPETADHDQP